MRNLGRRLRRHLSYATVVSSITAFVVLAGGAAFAANQLAKNSVGKKQLKANAVTTAKIKKNAVTKVKIKAGAVDGTKVKDGSLGVGNLNLADMPFSRIVHQARGSSTVDVGSTYGVYPLGDATYTQPSGEDDFFGGALDITFPPGCGVDRDARGEVLVDAPNPLDPRSGDIVAVGRVEDEAGGTVTKHMVLGVGEAGGARFQPDVATNHTLTLVIEADCKSGAGVTASNGAVDVIGVGR
jgi:hypothetical protein